MSIAKTLNLMSSDNDFYRVLVKAYPDKFKINEFPSVRNGSAGGEIKKLESGLGDPNFGTDYLYFKFAAEQHFETRQELPRIYDNVFLDFFSAEFKLEYNFLLPVYEDGSVYGNNELDMPNFYDTAKEFSSGAANLTKKADPLKTATMLNTSKYRKIFYGSVAPKTENVLSNINRIINPPASRILAQKPKSFGGMLKEYNAFKELYPFYTDIRFNVADKNNIPFSKIFDNSGIFKALLKFCSENIAEKPQPYFVTTDTGTQYQSTLKSCDLRPFLQEHASDTTFQSQIGNLILKKSLSYTDILVKKTSYSEVIGYRLVKTDSNNSNIIQEWYLPNLEEDSINFIDTQIHYNKFYTYSLSTLVLVIGAKYSYTNQSNSGVYNNFVIEPEVEVYEIDDTTYTNKLLDFPPLEPEIDIISYLQSSTKIKINLNTSVGARTLVPFIFKEEEILKIEELKNAQDRTDNKLIYQTDEASDYFEMYRIEIKPKTYKDFSKATVTKIENNDSSAGSFIDTLEPNKEYYYTFRSIDYHGHISNPSQIYQVKLINENGAVFPVISVFNFESLGLLGDTKEFKRYLSITPSVGNKIFVDEPVGTGEPNVEAIKIGVNEPGVWNRQFKIRITSKSTGKKIDINFGFDIKRER